HSHLHRIGYLIADDLRRSPILPLFVERLHGEIRGLDVLRVQALGFQRGNHLGHGGAVLGERLPGRRRLGGDTGRDIDLVRRRLNGAGGGERDGALRRFVGAEWSGGKRGKNEQGEEG